MSVAGVAALLATAAFLTAGPASAAPNTSRWGANYFPNVELTTHEGKKVKFYDDLIKGKTVAIYLMYTTCQYNCPLETARLAQVQRFLGDRVGKDIFFVSVTIDPKHDTPEVLNGYAQRFHAGPGWTFVTGKPEDIELISKKLGLYTEPDPSNKDGHTPRLLIGDEPTGQWMENSALDNPRYLAVQIGELLSSWKHHKETELKNYAQAPGIDISDRGRYLFATKCAACHTIGHGDSVGPDLLGVANVHDRVWLARYIYAPNAMMDAKDPVALALQAKYKLTMPNLSLERFEVEQIVEFLAAQKGPTDARPGKAVAARPDGGFSGR